MSNGLVSHINKFVKGGIGIIEYLVFESFCYSLRERETGICFLSIISFNNIEFLDNCYEFHQTFTLFELFF